jgi:drug/metabolite transporter (DMT)-like permease
MASVINLFAEFLAFAILLVIALCIFSTPFRRIFFFGIGAAIGGAVGWVTGSAAKKIRESRKP